MIQTPAISKLVLDLARSLEEQFRYIPSAPIEAQEFYEAAIKDSTIAVATALHKHIGDFNVDTFYLAAGYPGTHPIHSRKSQ